MPSEVRLAPKDRRRILAQLSRERLGDLTTRFELDVVDRRSSNAHVNAILRKRSLDFRRVLESLQRTELQAACKALGLETGGRDKSTLIERILGEPASASAEHAAANTNQSSVPPADSTRGLGAVKSALRRFVLDTAGGYRGRDAAATFTSRLLQCFGWPAEGPASTSMPSTLHIVDNAQRTTRQVALNWPERRVLVEVVQHDVMLDYAWKELLRVCLQVNPAPQYVVLTNQRDLQLYDLGRARDQPRLSIAVDDLPKYSEAFPFLAAHWVPGTTPKIVDVSKVSRDVAELVARLYRSLRDQHPKRARDVVQFTLQCILTMFAEDIGLLPKEYFTSLLYEGARTRDIETRLREMFDVMSTRDVPPPRVVPYFNGGLFTQAVTLPLGDSQLQALIKASEANWTYVDPHIFGSVFQGIMDASDRHKHGVHYTAHDDIMRVVGPTIVEPWRQRIRSAKTLAELFDTRTALLKFRVLDPACGSGNFLYVAFRELYRLDTELLARMREFPSTQGEGRNKMTWGAGIQTSNFYGIDINPFAVELAKVTLNIAKKIAFEERREFAADVEGQVELDVDPSLPLDNLDKNIVCADALFAEWPHADAIVGNPPFLGGGKISSALGASYLRSLQGRFPEVNGRADFCAYWFRRAHDSLGDGCRAGLIATNSVREGNTMEASTGYVVANGGTITNAVSSRPWPGEAVVTVSMVNWVKGPAAGPHHLVIEDHVYEREIIPAHLRLHADLSTAKVLRANASLSTKGVDLGTRASQFASDVARELRADPAGSRFVKPVALAMHLLSNRLSADPEYTVDLSSCSDLCAAKRAGKAFKYIERTKLPQVEAKAASYEGWLERWWQPWRPRDTFFRTAAGLRRLLVCSRHAARPIFAFLSREFVPTDSLQLFALGDDYSFGILQSNVHWSWATALGSKIEERTRYTMEVWDTFTWPQEPSEAEVAKVVMAARNLRGVRASLMEQNGLSLRSLHQAGEVAGHPLKEAQAELDAAVRAAYGMSDEQEATDFLLELNRFVAEDETEGHKVQGPGLPANRDPHDPRWTSADCIEPPPTAPRNHG